jgi:hypothetical protein
MVELLVNQTVNTIGGLMYNGACLSIDLYGARGEKTFKSYHIFGDVSLQVRTDTPASMTVQHESVIDIGSSSFEVTVFGVANALCAVSYDNALLGHAYTDDTDHALIQFDQPISVEGPLDLVVTAYNKRTYMAQITVNTGGFLRGDANGDGEIDVADITYLINYLFLATSAPNPLWVGDCNCDGVVDIGDIVYLINYLFLGGAPPGC